MAVRVRERRQAAGLSPAEAARLSGIALGNYYQLERGAGNPTLTTLMKICRGLDVDAGELVRGLGS
jgi:transcriptional regulator with XRE-family HTH domain